MENNTLGRILRENREKQKAFKAESMPWTMYSNGIVKV